MFFFLRPQDLYPKFLNDEFDYTEKSFAQL